MVLSEKNIIEPFFFGNADRRLFGCYHSPPAGMKINGIVVLCQTIGQEYIHSHRAFFQLAMRLAAKGNAALRFDYYGCGDSEGDFKESSFTTWVSDVGTAIEEIQLRSGLQDVCLVGFRIGAALALQTALRNKAIKSLVLWEIVHNGINYLKETAKLQADLSLSLKYQTEPSEIDASLPGEMLGFKLTTQLIQDFRALKLTAADIPINCKSLIIYNRESAPSEFVVNVNTPSNGNPNIVRCIEDPKLWENELYRRLIPVNTIDQISTWMESVTS